MRSARVPALVLAALLLGALGAPALADVDDLADAWVEAIGKVNEGHARSPGKAKEGELAKRLPETARASLQRLLAAEDAPATFDALAKAGEAALDLDLVSDFDRVRARLEKSSPPHAARLGLAVSRPRFLVRGLGGLEAAWLASFADVVDLILDAYDEVFGFEEWSKVPGKKIRFRVHLEPRIERPPHFAPQFPFHSEVDFPVADARAFTSPTHDGKFLFYGLCHELGHLVAMWGDRDTEADHHAWAHYTGVTIVEHLAAKRPAPKALEGLKDVRWRSLEKERQDHATRAPGLGSNDAVMALWIALHDAVGPKALGAAINLLDAKDDRLRVNRVRYYTFAELKTALLQGTKGAARKAVQRLLP